MIGVPLANPKTNDEHFFGSRLGLMLQSKRRAKEKNAHFLRHSVATISHAAAKVAAFCCMGCLIREHCCPVTGAAQMPNETLHLDRGDH